MTRLTELVQDRLESEAGLFIIVEESHGALVLTGSIDSDNDRQAAFDIVHEVAPDMPIDDNLEIDELQPKDVQGMTLSEVESGLFAGAEPGTYEDEAIEPGDFMDQPEMTDPVAASGTGEAELDFDKVSSGDRVYTPPIDPVGTDDNILGGFEASADDEIASNRGRGDEALADEARQALRLDSATQDLDIDVEVFEGYATLRGRVPTITDTDLAAGVVSRVPGVKGVRDELEAEAGRML